MKPTKVICPGSYDPITIGHVDIIKRAAALYDEVVVAVMKNNEKKTLFSLEERKRFVECSLKDIPNVTVISFEGLLAGYVKDNNITAIVKGVRNTVDFEYENSLAIINKSLYEGAETVFIPTDPKYLHISSSVVRAVSAAGGDISGFVPTVIYNDVLKSINERT